MKRLATLIKGSEAIFYKDITLNHYIGVEISGYKGFVAIENWRQGVWKVLSRTSITIGKHFDHLTRDDFHECLRKAIQDGTVYVFDNYQELFTWLAE